MGLQWNEFELPGKKLPQWKRTFEVDQETSQVFVTAALTGDVECPVWGGASRDDVHAYTRRDHDYVPADWMTSEFPKMKSLCSDIQASVGERANHAC